MKKLLFLFAILLMIASCAKETERPAPPVALYKHDIFRLDKDTYRVSQSWQAWGYYWAPGSIVAITVEEWPYVPAYVYWIETDKKGSFKFTSPDLDSTKAGKKMHLTVEGMNEVWEGQTTYADLVIIK